MSLFATNETVKIYFDGDKLVGKETGVWFEVLKELPAHLDMELRKTFAGAKVVVFEDGSYQMDLSDVQGAIPFKFLAQVIKGWSESVPPTIENLKKVKSSIMWKLWAYLQRLYGIVNEKPEDLIEEG
ncbi:MAG TPA: hypothetical protein ENF81_07120 [Thermotogaceae bacterium]|nr:hypothetical protein [Thermotogaceae bacterium]